MLIHRWSHRVNLVQFRANTTFLLAVFRIIEGHVHSVGSVAHVATMMLLLGIHHNCRLFGFFDDILLSTDCLISIWVLSNDFCDLVFENTPILFNKHALLLLSEYESLVVT